MSIASRIVSGFLFLSAAFVVAVVLSGCQTVPTTPQTQEPVCDVAKDAIKKIADEIGGEAFLLSPEDRQTFLSNLNAAPPVTDHNWPFVFWSSSAAHPKVAIMAADKNGCVAAWQVVTKAEFVAMMTPRKPPGMSL